MLHLITALAALAVAAASSVASPAAKRDRAPPAPDAVAPSLSEGAIDDEPPPGAPADRALWKDAMGTSNRVVIERTNANRMQWQLKTGKYDERLAAARASGDAAQAKRAADAWPRLAEVRARNYAILTSQWPVDPTRGCRYEVLLLEGAMAEVEKPRQLAAAREHVQECLEKARGALRTLIASNEELQRAIADADRAVPPVLPASARAGAEAEKPEASAAPSGPGGAAARAPAAEERR